MDQETRWNSWYNMISVSLKLKQKLMDWIDENFQSLEEDALTDEDWQELRVTRLKARQRPNFAKILTESTVGSSTILRRLAAA
jgi:hypothetical protein